MRETAPPSHGLTRQLTVLAQDPSVRGRGGRALTTKLTIPAERLDPGPRGARLEVVDFDATADCFYKPRKTGLDDDPYDGETDIEKLAADPHFHAQNAYAIAAHTLFLFEKGLGRRLAWGFDYGTHQLKILPHAFCDANAFYSRRDEALFFGYFEPRGRNKGCVFTCLSRDIATHETVHGLLDGLKRQFDRPSSPDQGAFHEGFADVVALLSVLSSKEFLEQALIVEGLVERGAVQFDKTLDAIKKTSFLTGVAEEFGLATETLGRDALRRSTRIKPSTTLLDSDVYQEAHDRGELFAAMVLRAHLSVWRTRLVRTGPKQKPPLVEAWRVAEEGAKAAEHLLRLLVRALDYLPPVHLTFADMLSAALTADRETYPDDSRFDYRGALTEAFAAFGVAPAARTAEGLWRSMTDEVCYDFARFEALRHDPTEVFRFLYENRGVLGLADSALTRVESVHPVVRVGEDGFLLRETVAQYYQLIEADRAELAELDIPAPKFLRDGRRVQVHGGGTLIFDEFGRLKFHIHNHLARPSQRERLEHLHASGALEPDGRRRFAAAHLARTLGQRRTLEDWD
jgi:hypothetical protein